MLPARGLQAESWTDLSGTRTIEADLVGLFGDQLILQLPDGRKLNVKLDQLRAESRIQAKDLHERQTAARADRVAELRRQAGVAAAAAPDPLPEPVAAPEYQPPTDGISAVETLQYLVEQFRAGHFMAFYDSLPEDYRDEIDQLVAQASLKLNESAWNDLVGSVHGIGDLVVTHQNWLFSHPRLKDLGAEATEPLKEMLLPMAGLLRSGFDPETMGLHDLQTMGFRDWLVRWDQATAPYLAELGRSSGAVVSNYEQVREQRGVVTIRVIQGDLSTDIDMKQVDGYWVVADLVDQWPTFFEKAQEMLDETPDGSLNPLGFENAAILLAAAQGIMESLRGTSDATQFHTALDSLLSFVTPETLASVLPAAYQLPGTARPGYAGTGDYGMDDDMYDPGMDDAYDPDLDER